MAPNSWWCNGLEISGGWGEEISELASLRNMQSMITNYVHPAWEQKSITISWNGFADFGF